MTAATPISKINLITVQHVFSLISPFICSVILIPLSIVLWRKLDKCTLERLQMPSSLIYRMFLVSALIAETFGISYCIIVLLQYP